MCSVAGLKETESNTSAISDLACTEVQTEFKNSELYKLVCFNNFTL